jgi:hypothetical protein
MIMVVKKLNKREILNLMTVIQMQALEFVTSFQY